MTLPPIDRWVHRTMDPRFLNEVANHPDVRPWLGGDGPLDVTALLANPANVGMVCEDGGFLAVAHGGGRSEVHSLFLPTKARGTAVRAMRSAVEYFFTATDGVELLTKVPAGNPAAQGLTHLAGFEMAFTVTLPWTGGVRKQTDCYRLGIDRWALRSAAALECGAWLHEAFGEIQKAWVSKEGPHAPDDPAHHYAAGAALLMVQAGNAAKGVEFYNRWARFAGYPPIRLLSEHPTVIDLEGIIVDISGNEIEVLLCR